MGHTSHILAKLALSAVLAFASGSVVQGDSVPDAGQDEQELLHDEARRALQSGLVLPLETILNGVRAKFPGDIIEIEFEKDDGRYIYEIEIIRPDGRVIEVKVDAKNMDVLEVEDD